MPAEEGQRPGGARRNTVAVAEFKEFARAVEEFHNIEVKHDVINGERVSKNGKIDRDFSDADQHVLTIGAMEGATPAAAISIAESPPPSPPAAGAAAPCASKTAASSCSPAAGKPSRQPPRSSRRGKLRARDSNASAPPQQQQQQQQKLTVADRGKRQQTVAAAGKEGGGGEAAAAVVPGPVKGEPDEVADKENLPAVRGRGRPPLSRRKKGGADGGGDGSTAAAAAAAPVGSDEPEAVASAKDEPLRRSGRNSGVPPLPPVTRHTRSSITSARSSGGGDGASGSKDGTGANGDDGSSGIADQIAELRAMKVSSMKVVDLKVELRKLGAPVGGLKAVLQVRLVEAINARISELGNSLPLATTAEGDGEEGDDDMEDEPAPSAAATTSSASSSACARSDSPSRFGRSSVAHGGALGPLTRLSMPRLSTESIAASSPVRVAAPFFGNEPEQQESAAAAATVAAAGAAAANAGAGAAKEGGGGGGDGSTENLVESDSDRLESDDGADGDEEMETGMAETDRVEGASEAGELGTRQGAGENAVAEAAVSSGEGEEELGDQPPLSPVQAAAAAATVDDDDGAASSPEALSAPVSGSVVPVADNEAEVIPGAAPADVPDDMVVEDEEEEEEEEAEEGEVLEEAGARGDGFDAAGDAAPEESGRKSGVTTDGGRTEVDAVSAAEEDKVSAESVAAEAGATGAASAVDDPMEVEESRDEEASQDVSPPDEPVGTKPVGHSDDSGIGDNSRDACRSPTPLLSSGGSSTTAAPGGESGVGSSGGSIGDSVGEKRARPCPTPAAAGEGSAASSAGAVGAGAGQSGGGGGGGKRPKICKEKLSLQEIMSQMRKTYAKKGGTPGAASKMADAGARKAAADFMAARKPAAVAPEAASAAAVPAAGPGPSSESTSTVQTAAAPAAPAAASSKPSNLITTLHSFTPMLSKGKAAAPLGKWDRLAAGDGASSGARVVPALRKAEEARLLEERRTRERAAARARTQALRARTQAAGAAAPSIGQQQQQPAAARGHGDRVASSDLPDSAGTAKGPVRSAAGLKSAADPDAKGGSSAGGGGALPPSLQAPLRVTGMLSKLVPGGGSGDSGVVAAAAAVAGAPSHKPKKSEVSPSDLPEPFRRSEDLFIGGAAAAAAAAAAADCDISSVRSAGSTASSCFSLGTSSAAGGGGASSSSTLSSSEMVEMKIRDQRAQIALKRNARMERLRAEDEKKKADLESKELRDAARLEASRRAKLESEAKVREQKAQRQAEVERRREQERAEKEARDARERQEKEARRLAAVAEAKAKAAQEAAAAKMLAVKKTAAAAAAATASGAASGGTNSGSSAPGAGAGAVTTTVAAEGKPVAVLKRVSPAPSGPGHAASSGGQTAATAPAAAAAAAVSSAMPSSSTLKPAGSSLSKPTPSATGKMPAAGTASAGAGAAGAGTFESYEMSDHDGETSESESDEEDMKERSRRAGKKIPAWAKGKALTEALTRQYASGQHIDPDQIFPEVFTCDLEAIFPVNKSRYHRRGSSANWTPHRITPQEVLTYKRSVGITRPQK